MQICNNLSINKFKTLVSDEDIEKEKNEESEEKCEKDEEQEKEEKQEKDEKQETVEKQERNGEEKMRRLSSTESKRHDRVLARLKRGPVLRGNVTASKPRGWMHSIR